MSERKRYKRPSLISNCKINAQPKNCQKSALFSKIYGGIYVENTINSYFCFAKCNRAM